MFRPYLRTYERMRMRVMDVAEGPYLVGIVGCPLSVCLILKHGSRFDGHCAVFEKLAHAWVGVVEFVIVFEPTQPPGEGHSCVGVPIFFRRACVVHIGIGREWRPRGRGGCFAGGGSPHSAVDRLVPGSQVVRPEPGPRTAATLVYGEWLSDRPRGHTYCVHTSYEHWLTCIPGTAQFNVVNQCERPGWPLCP